MAENTHSVSVFTSTTHDIWVVTMTKTEFVQDEKMSVPHCALPMMSYKALQVSEAAYSALHKHNTPFTHLRKESQVPVSSSATQGFSIQLCPQSGNWQTLELESAVKSSFLPGTY